MANKTNDTIEAIDGEVSDGSTEKPKILPTKTKTSTARMRWDILSQTLFQKSISRGDVESKPHFASVRRFETFGLIQLKPKTFTDSSIASSIDSTQSSVRKELLEGKWFECKVWDQSSESFTEAVLDIRLLTERIPIDELVNSLDNTGNVCLWPSEELLAYYSYTNPYLCSDKTVLELGGGMTCLCALVTAVSVAAKRVILTDGNQRCISNVRTIIEINKERMRAPIECRLLRWGQDLDFIDLNNQIDVIFCSDCLYFDKSRHLLVETIYRLLSSTGVAVLLAPTRGSTFTNFVDLAKELFALEIIENYDPFVYQLHQDFAEKALESHYVPDLHYPVMIRLRHKSCPPTGLSSE